MKSKNKTGLFLALISTAVSCSVTSQKEKPNNSLPNVIVIFLDDMGYGDLSLTGATGYKTPNIDKMASQGMFFTHFYSAQAVCSASRAGLLTGCYPNRIGLSGALSPDSKVGIAEEEETIAEVLQKRGYATAIFGKWHLGVQQQFLPTNHGFDEFIGIPYSNDMWPLHPSAKFPDLPIFENETIVNPAVTPEDQAQFTAIFTMHTIDFIKRHQNQPFFIYLPHPMPHVPLYVSDKFKGKSKQGLYGDVMMEIDWSVGEIIETLKETNLLESTLIIFTSDNGPWLNYGNHAGNTSGFREGKGTTFEGGQRVPCLMMWKGIIPEGAICNSLISAIDIMPTLAEIANAPLPKNKIDGVSLLTILKGDLDANPRQSFYYYYKQNSLEAVRQGDWKLVFPHSGRSYEGFQPGNDGVPGPVNRNFQFPGGLYDLRRDPGERYDVSESYPDIVKTLEELADNARQDLGDDLKDYAGLNRREPGKVFN